MEAIRFLREHATKATLTRKAWATEAAFDKLTAKASKNKEGTEIVLDTPIAKVQAVLAKILKPQKKLVHAVKFTDGKIEEVRGTLAAPPKTGTTPYRDPGEREAEVGVTVAEPVIGCPVPEFPESEIRANLVLEAFLTPQQREDYRSRGAFLSVGADTGHTYAVTHRERRGSMRHVSFRSLYDLTEDRPLCVHDWDVPAPEEMLALHLCITLPGNEERVRALPEVWL